MPYDEHPKGEGVAFINNDRTKDTHPHLRGHIDVTDDQIRRMIEMRKSGLEAKLQIGIWKRKSKAGAKYLFIGTEAYMKGEATRPPPEPEVADDDWEDDDIPF